MTDIASSSSTTAVVVFAKPPEPGRVKTRLTDRLSEERAARLYGAFLDDMAALVGDLRLDGTPPSRVFAYAGDADHPGFAPFREASFTLVEQGGGDLGDRLRRVVERCFEAGVERIALLGSDSPHLQPRHLEEGFARLGAGTDVVLGPAFDGGYYLLQMAGPHTGLFEGVDWSTPRVTEQTLERCRALGLDAEWLEFWYDIDDFADLDRVRYHIFGHLRDGDGWAAPATADALRRLQRDEGVFDLSEDNMTPIDS